MELGVAAGEGLLALQEYANIVEAETGVVFHVYGFDTGAGLPDFCDDYRDHPDKWMPGDYPMDEAVLRAKLGPRAHLLIGNIVDTVPDFVENRQQAPLGFVSVDVDLYSSTRGALQLFLHPRKSMLRWVSMYFDDVDLVTSHRFASELLAIEEFNARNDGVRIDRWRGIKRDRPFPEESWLERMYVAHDLDAISKVQVSRPPDVSA